MSIVVVAHRDVAVADLQPGPHHDPAYVREHVVEQIATSFARDGQVRPILVSTDNRILAGRHRWLAAQKLGWATIRAEVVEADDIGALAIMCVDSHCFKSTSEAVAAINRTWGPIIAAAERVEDLPEACQKIFGHEKTGSAALQRTKGDAERDGFLGSELISKLSGNTISEGDARAVVSAIKGIANGTVTSRVLDLERPSHVQTFVRVATGESVSIREQEAFLRSETPATPALVPEDGPGLLSHLTTKDIRKRLHARSPVGIAERRVRAVKREEVPPEQKLSQLLEKLERRVDASTITVGQILDLIEKVPNLEVTSEVRLKLRTSVDLVMRVCQGRLDTARRAGRALRVVTRAEKTTTT